MRLLILVGLSLAATAEASSLGTVTLTPSFETSGVIVQTSGDSGNEVVAVEVKGPTDAAFHAAHPSTRFEPGGFATSLFDLTPDTDYSIRVTLTDPDGVTGTPTQTLTLHTRAETTVPAPLRTVWVGPTGQDTGTAGTARVTPYLTLTYAFAHAQPGDQIRVLAGTYGPSTAIGLHGTEVAPITLIADDATTKPIIDGQNSGSALTLDDTSYLVIDGFEITNGGADDSGHGLYLRASARNLVRNCFIHDNGHENILVSKSAEFSGGVLLGGFHLIEDNEIADLVSQPCSGGSNTACPGMTYYGIKMDNNPGAGNVVRRNYVHGHDDNTSPCGDEDVGRDLADGQPVLALIGSGTWTNHDLEFYDNRFVNARDDGMELDGICVNARIWRNVIDGAQNSFSAAPVMPGPYFFVRNVATGPIVEAGFKINTAGNSAVPSRHVFVYQNTFVWTTNHTMLNMWFAVEGDHNVPIHDFVFRNNVFSAPVGGTLINSYNHGTEEPSFDGDVWFTTNASGIFSWWNGATTDSYDTFAAFQTGTGEETHGAFGMPGLGADFHPMTGALVVDNAVAIPGINDHFQGAGPDVGAFELGGSATDGGMMGTDAGLVDGGSVDAGRGDAGVSADGGMLPQNDGGTGNPDGGTGTGVAGGCNCEVGRASSSAAWVGSLWGALLFALVVRRRVTRERQR